MVKKAGKNTKGKPSSAEAGQAIRPAEGFPVVVIGMAFVLVQHLAPDHKSILSRRMAINQIDHLDGYLGYVQRNPGEADGLFCDLLIGVTNFFRDPEAFKALEVGGIPRLFEGKPPGAAVWVPGCSMGEEAYSLAILHPEHPEARKRDFPVQVFATDIDSRAIEQARAGVYPAGIAEM